MNHSIDHDFSTLSLSVSSTTPPPPSSPMSVLSVFQPKPQVIEDSLIRSSMSLPSLHNSQASNINSTLHSQPQPQPQPHFHSPVEPTIQATALLSTLNRRPPSLPLTHQPPMNHSSSYSSPTNTVAAQPQPEEPTTHPLLSLLLQKTSLLDSQPQQLQSQLVSSSHPEPRQAPSADFLSGSPAPQHPPLLDHQDQSKALPAELQAILNPNTNNKQPHPSSPSLIKPQQTPFSPQPEQSDRQPDSTYTSSGPINTVSHPSPLMTRLDPPKSDPSNTRPDTDPTTPRSCPTIVPAPPATAPQLVHHHHHHHHHHQRSVTQADTPESGTQNAQTPTGMTNSIVLPTNYMASQYISQAQIKPTKSYIKPDCHYHQNQKNLDNQLIKSIVQEIKIDIKLKGIERLYGGSPPNLLPITLFPSTSIFSKGKKVGVDGFISYATKVGRIRVIDQSSGARMLLRRHEGTVIDMGIGRPERRWRCIGTIGNDSRLVIWKVPVRFEEESAGYEILVEVSGHFCALAWHPRLSSVLLISTNDHKLVLIKLDRGAFGGMWKRGAPVGKSLNESEAFEGQEVIQTNGNVVAFCFSPDGTAFAFVTDDGMLTVRQTSKPHWTIMGGRLGGQSCVDKLEFIGGPKPSGFLVSRDNGRRVELVELNGTTLVEIIVEPPENERENCFGHVAYVTSSRTVLLSNSLRGSIFVFKLKLDCTEDSIEDDASFIETRRGIGGGMWVERYSELASPDPILSFVTDDGKTRPDDSLSVFNIHPKGIHQLFIPRELVEDELPSEPERVSIAGGILVDVESIEQVDIRAASPPALSNRPISPPLAPIQPKPLRTVRSKVRQTSVPAEFGNSTNSNVSTVTEESLRKLEERVVERLSTAFKAQIDNLERRWERERAEERVAETARQEQLLGMVSDALERNVRAVLETLVRDEVRESVVPAVVRVIEETVNSAIENVPIPTVLPNRSHTPPESYEDIFLQALSDNTISELIDEGSHDRLNTVFGSNQLLSQPVLLTLAHKLSEELGNSKGKLGRKGANRLRWIWNRVLELIENCLINRRSSGLVGEDLIGINEVLKLVVEKRTRSKNRRT
ncbi:hypothetical protein CROQUDRAFT_658934 [Cronartium quercuum f. sp. fusiforme G11]|uniref:Enhancer of mRNA-decapping protein 4 WD40 repeat region domain-containing protein n=1 Tax=Cronartium quercuum f. sp. fusiforme G11 TaxID=708437 RepID=A0A9P6TAJ0_9BASI|nr:hypothetical protein CROQUDRAFT_658934 [Cronartium quercuum f. sp. fusiforme G11]